LDPRYSIFLDGDGVGSVIVGASMSQVFGQPYKNVTYSPGNSSGMPFTELKFEIHNEENGSLLVTNTTNITSTREVFEFSLSSFTARSNPYQISIYGTSPDGQQVYTDSTSIYVLPSRSYGSVVRIDNMFGGLFVQNVSIARVHSIFDNPTSLRQ
jgi:hypothetical protein